MAKQIDLIGREDVGVIDESSSLGHLIWWSIPKRNYEPIDLINLAHQCEVPDIIKNNITGKKPIDAWKTATQLGVKGLASAPTPDDPEDCRVRYMTKLITGTGFENVRLIVREVIDQHDEAMSVVNIAVVKLDELNQFRAKLQDDCMHHACYVEAQEVIQDMEDQYKDLIGTTNDARLRSLLMQWLDKCHRITLRKSGGVYQIPRPQDKILWENRLHDLKAIRAFINNETISGIFSTVELFPSDTTTQTDFIKAGLDELKDDCEKQHQFLVKLTSLDSKASPETKVYRAEQIIGIMGDLNARLDSYEAVFGDAFATGRDMVKRIIRRAEGLKKENQELITIARRRKQSEEKRLEIYQADDQPVEAGPKRRSRSRAAKGNKELNLV